MLGDYARDLHRRIPNEGLTLPTARSIMQSMRGLVDTMDAYGPACAGRYVSFMKLFPNLCKITGRGPGLRVMKADRPEREPRPAQGSTDRAPRAFEFLPRAAYTRFRNETAVIYQDKNPARPNGESYERYEKYKKANT